MPQCHCHRCHSVLHAEDEGTLIYCWNCGAAQITLSEELQELAATQRAEFAANSQTSQGAPTSSGMLQVPDLYVLWRPMIGIAAAVAAGLSVTSIILPPVEMLSWLAPGLVLALYASRHRQTHITAGVGARVGLVCGVLVSFGMTVATTLRMLVERFGLHSGNEFDQMKPQLLQLKIKLAAQSGQAVADAVVDPMINLPEFHAGLVVGTLGMLVAIIVVLSIAGGAFTGFVRSRTRKAAR